MSNRALPFEPVHRLFERHAKESPNAIAVRYRNQSLTYRKLEQLAGGLARALLSRGIGAERRVAVYVEPRVEIAVALLGTLKAGAVYVPIDPTLPTARIQAIVEHVQPDLVISATQLDDETPFAGVPIVQLDARDADVVDGGEGNEESEEEEKTAAVGFDPDQTAYIYFTSGTTGAPKGVMGSHANLCAYLGSARARYGFCPGDVMPAIARFGFSISMFELLSPLTTGGTLIVLDRDHVMSAERMMQTLREVTCFHAGPSLMKYFVAHIRAHEPDLGVFSRLRHVSLGGDTVAPELLESVKELFGRAEVFVIYGCTEISCMGCTYEAPRDRTLTRTYVGGPFDNVIVQVRNEQGQPSPKGEAGEIWIAGHGVTKGYWADPEQTNAKFVGIDGRRFYRTGDVGKWSEDGCLELLGRVDFQVKIRGMRVELGEVERALRGSPGVKDGIVAAIEGANGEKVLVAYFVAEDGDEVDNTMAEGRPARTAAIRRHMVEMLPDYMVPASYVELAALPLNANLKVDRRSLPDPRGETYRRTAIEASRVAATQTEKELLSIVRKTLGIDDVGLDDNFFELGGDSILGLRFLTEVERVVGVELTGMDVLRESVEVLAAICDERLGVRRPSEGRGNEAIARRRSRDGAAVETFFFGREKGLYGVLHPAGPKFRTDGQSVLICSPLGQEAVRAHFVLYALARRLSRQGLPVLRFDYFGTHDSQGEAREASCERWQRDIEDAFDELERRTGRSRITVVAVRAGAMLACNALRRKALSGLVVWDPVCSGARYCAELLRLHRECLAQIAPFRRWRKMRATRGECELLGMTYSEEALSQLKRMSIASDLIGAHVPIRWLATAHGHGEHETMNHFGGGQGVSVDVDCRWDDLNSQEQILPDVGISATLARMIVEAMAPGEAIGDRSSSSEYRTTTVSDARTRTTLREPTPMAIPAENV